MNQVFIKLLKQHIHFNHTGMMQVDMISLPLGYLCEHFWVFLVFLSRTATTVLPTSCVGRAAAAVTTTRAMHPHGSKR